MTPAFREIDIPRRPPKPRTTGVTMMIDWGIPLSAQREQLALAGAFIDLAKIAVGISGLIPTVQLSAKVLAYREAGVDPFPGGMFLEMASAQEKVDYYYRECLRMGYRTIEVSDNVVPLSPQTRERLIRQAVEEHGLRVLGEVGSKHEETDFAELIAGIQGSLEAGAWKVFVEAAEFVGPEGFDMELARRLLDQVDGADIIFELPGRWIADVHAHQIYRMMVWLVDNVGPDVNIANVDAGDVVALETLRTGVGVNMVIQ